MTGCVFTWVGNDIDTKAHRCTGVNTWYELPRVRGLRIMYHQHFRVRADYRVERRIVHMSSLPDVNSEGRCKVMRFLVKEVRSFIYSEIHFVSQGVRCPVTNPRCARSSSHLVVKMSTVAIKDALTFLLDKFDAGSLSGYETYRTEYQSYVDSVKGTGELNQLQWEILEAQLLVFDVNTLARLEDYEPTFMMFDDAFLRMYTTLTMKESTSLLVGST